MHVDAMDTPQLVAVVPIGPDTTATELMVMSWFAAGHEVLWIPIIEVGSDREGAEHARVDAEQIGEPRVLRAMADLAGLPHGIKGWLVHAHLDNTCVVAVRGSTPWPSERSPTRSPVRR
ncbi:hypothetical protein [Plasticicumulans acidivorans]|uniref:Uncharacterized protein n=1 Tax=Plasticicumulans acidivorans TaxID=886464 RepID=A0A317MW91_9GAMM|nr:hypothetical protein [Plasticicumulans acidivorans]PWV59029.1 hypothetical protein C7443_11226 [Plasticicumulans acidivorans]